MAPRDSEEGRAREMITYRIWIVCGQREQLLTVNAESRAKTAEGAHVFFDAADRPIAWVPEEIVVQIEEV